MKIFWGLFWLFSGCFKEGSAGPPRGFHHWGQLEGWRCLSTRGMLSVGGGADEKDARVE